MAHRRMQTASAGRRMAHPKWPGRAAALIRSPALRRNVTGRLAGEPRRREMAVVLALLLLACVFSAAGLSGTSGTGAGTPSGTSSFRAAGLSHAGDDPTALPTLTPDQALLALQYSVPMAPDPTPVPTATPEPTASPVPTPAPKKSTAPARIYRFVALGDSLTAWPANPWPSRLASLDPQLKLIRNAGVPGNVTAQMRARLSSDVLAYKPDVLFVMGGTNDLAQGYSQATIVANLRAIVTTAQAHGIHVFLLTIPPDSYPEMVSRISSLNGAIVALGTSLNVRVTNIARPLSSSAGTYQARYTSDGLHFSALGAQVVANTIYARIKPVGY
ncbi:MAG TPA: GDSL-type esterase/lipase family protein [Candidatus Limnocylindrales bacterium]